MPEFAFGTAGYIKFGSTVLSSDERSFDPEEEVNTVDRSAGNDAARSYLATLLDGRATWEGVAQTGGTALWAAVAPRTEGTLEWGEEGTATGKPKHTVVALVTRRARANPYDEVSVLTVDFQFQAAVTDSTY